ncbi:DUF4082 domain-containing protein [Limimaricola variabilis]|uniref:DUF4082 domain-containing protein n=1 Tax=Limimaricola variabilis TaxID=1492771 RepID=UPI002AC926AB|nr:DUF4082 domain-containing protein [Limimaricola variabilis]WPY95393.1 DUF4082 domain-containing protein [Limimaricola variabilis]
MASNAIVTENARTDGRMPQTYWDVPHSRQIEGFTTDISVNAGSTVDFKINVNGGAGSDYRVEIFRLGYYGGDGARMVASWTNTEAVVQPGATFDPVRGTADAGNWSVTDSWTTPVDAVSGVYLARLQRLDANGNPIAGAVNQIPFILREDDRPADIVLQTSDTTWQAYNGWIGNNGQVGANFYGDSSGTISHPDIVGDRQGNADRAYALSYNRPFVTRGIEGVAGGPASGAQDYLFGADYAAIYWLERNGYDVSYIAGVDPERLGAAHLGQFKSYLSVGHDEYWSGGQRANVEAARDAGTHLLFWGGNDVYWKTRWEPSGVDGANYRTLVSYKETWTNINPSAGPADYLNLDPTDIWTGTWRDTRFIGNPAAGTTTPENALTGQLFLADGTGQFGGALDVPASMAGLRLWRDTSVAANGGATGISPGLIGYEWNVSPQDANRPAGLIHLSSTELAWGEFLVDQGNSSAPGTGTHNLSLYRAESGALVFGAGTVFWTWALSDKHDSQPYGATIASPTLQQFTINLFADMGIQPGAADPVLLAQGLIRAFGSTDTVAGSALLDQLPASLPAFQPVTITGRATDDDGNPQTQDGRIALVEVSLDGGTTWQAANGTTTWSYSWLPTVEATYDIRVRAIDDSLNLPSLATLDRWLVEVTAPTTPGSLNLFSPWKSFSGTLYQTSQALQLGTQFSATSGGQITELRYFRAEADSGDTDVRAGRLWRADGTLLGTVEFTSTPGQSGWQTAALNAPIQVSAGATYIVTYETLDAYVSSHGFFDSVYREPYGLLQAPAQTGGVFATGAGAILPTQSYRSSNYWVDVTFAPSTSGNAAPTITSPANFAISENTGRVGIITAQDPEADPIAFAITGGADAARFSIDGKTGALNFVWAPDYEAPGDADRNNVYELRVSANDGKAAPVTKALTVTVGDVADETSKTISTLFGPSHTPARIVTDDPTDYELGTRFTARSAAEVTSLRYWRGAADASDTDVRVLNLWDANGNRLASATVTSAPDQIGWQVAALDTPVQIAAGARFTVSYGTTQNYAMSQNYFATPQTGPDGLMTSAGSGVFSAGGTGAFPTQTYFNSNYWVDASLRATGTTNAAPSFTMPGTAFSSPENQTRVTTITARDPDGDSFIFSIAGGDDAAAFRIDQASGALSFRTAPDYEQPGDANRDNVYNLVLAVSDGIKPATQKAITVAVSDVEPETATTQWSLFGSADRPALIKTSDPTDYELGVKFRAEAAGSVTALRYWRGAEDASDTDIRTLNLWGGDGVKLASKTVTSAPGEVGWQVAVLDTAINIDPTRTYVASYGTTQNYAFSSGFFASEWVGPGGHLSAPSGPASNGNGVFSAGSTGFFPEQTYQSSNYWVDVIMAPVTTTADVFA